MSTTADIFAVGSEFVGPDGTKYTLRPLVQYEQGQFQRWLEDRAHAAVDRSSVSEEQKDRAHARIYTDSALGKYEWEGPFAIEALWTVPGLAKVVEIVCRDQGVSTSMEAERIVAHSAKQVAAKILKVGAKDPKAMSLALDALGIKTGWHGSEQNEPSSDSSSTPRSAGPSPNSPDSPTTSSYSSTPSSAAPMG